MSIQERNLSQLKQQIQRRKERLKSIEGDDPSDNRRRERQRDRIERLRDRRDRLVGHPAQHESTQGSYQAKTISLDDLDRVDYPSLKNRYSRRRASEKRESAEYPEVRGNEKKPTPKDAAKQTTGRGKHPKKEFPSFDMVTPERGKKLTKDPYSELSAKHRKMPEEKDPCWDDYEMVGTKKKNGKKVPNCVPKNEETVDEALSVSARRKRSRDFRKYKTKIARGRKRQEKKLADRGRLMDRARKQARNNILKKLTKGQSKGDLSYARRAEIEKRLEKMKSRIDREAKKLLPKKRKADRERRK